MLFTGHDGTGEKGNGNNGELHFEGWLIWFGWGGGKKEFVIEGDAEELWWIDCSVKNGRPKSKC